MSPKVKNQIQSKDLGCLFDNLRQMQVTRESPGPVDSAKAPSGSSSATASNEHCDAQLPSSASGSSEMGGVPGGTEIDANTHIEKKGTACRVDRIFGGKAAYNKFNYRLKGDADKEEYKVLQAEGDDDKIKAFVESIIQ